MSTLVEIAKIAPRLVIHGTDGKAGRKILKRGFRGGKRFDGHVWTASPAHPTVEPLHIAEGKGQLHSKSGRGRGTVIESFAFGKPVDEARPGSGDNWQVWRPDQLQPIGRQMTPKHVKPTKARVDWERRAMEARHELDGKPRLP